MKISKSDYGLKKWESLTNMMAGASPEVQKKVIEVLLENKIEPDDPLVLIFGAMTEAKYSIISIPEQLDELQKGINKVVLALCEEVQTSLKCHKELNADFYVTAERLSKILNQKLFEIEQKQKRRQGALSISFTTALLWCLVTSSIGGVVGAILISMLMMVTAAQ